MFDPSERKYEIESKLEKRSPRTPELSELDNLNLLRERTDKSSRLTKGMVGILSSFELRLARLEETILPVYNETENLQRRQENIENTLAALDHVIGFYGVSQEVEPVIHAGPGGAGLDSFLAAMGRLQAAQEYFLKNIPQSVELENVSTLFNSGGDALNREFKELLSRYSKPVPPITLLDLVSADDDTAGEEGPASLQHFPDPVADELVRLAEWLMAHGRDEYMNVYARVRATVLLRSLQHLREHQKTASGGSAQGVPAASSPVVRQKFQSRHETPSRRASKRLQHVLEKRANRMLLKATQTLEQSTGLTLGPRRSALHLEAREDAVDEQETDNYLECMLALQRLMQAERHLMVGIVPLQHQHQVFEIVVRDAMDSVVQDGENIAARAKRCMDRRHDFAAVLVVFPMLKHLLAMKPDFDRTVEGCDQALRAKFTSILNTLHATGWKALEDFVESVRGDAGTQLPRDGTVHELTSNVLVFLEQLLDYTDTIAAVLGQEPAYANVALARGDRGRALLGVYIRKVLAQLNLTLLNKSELYGEPCLRAVFRLNNTHHVLKALQRSGLLECVRLSEPGCEQLYLDAIRDHKAAYAQSWGRVLAHIEGGDDGAVMLVPAGKLRDRDRALIKEKFAGFNKEMEEIARVQRGYSVPDVELREGLKRDNKELVLPKYSAFCQKYSNVPFTKNPEKYMKYTPEQVSALIDRFFDVAA